MNGDDDCVNGGCRNMNDEGGDNGESVDVDMNNDDYANTNGDVNDNDSDVGHGVGEYGVGRGGRRCGGRGSGSLGRGGQGHGSRGRVGRRRVGGGRVCRGCGGRGRGGRGRGGRGRGRCPNVQQSSSKGDNRVWNEDSSDKMVESFQSPVGPNIPVSDILQLFLSFFTMEVVTHIVTETNRYARMCREIQNIEKTWETSEEEILAYLGFTLLMGLNQLPHIYYYWSSDSVFHNFFISSRISRSRFLDIKRYLHFVDNTTLVPRGETGYDKLGKIRHLLNLIRKQTLTNYSPHRENSIDEAMIRYKGRSSLKQYLPKKPIKRGIKVWVRADSHNGYICDYQVYTGKDGDTATSDLGGAVVRKLSQEISHKNHHLYYDNYFTSVPLMEDLLRKKIYFCATFRRDRKHIPEELRYLREGNSRYM